MKIEIEVRIAYFTNTYPRATDTFIQREVKGLRERGIDVLTYSVRRTGSDHDVGPEVVEEKRRTDYLLPVNPFALLLDNIRMVAFRPRRYLKALRLAWRTSRPGIRGHIYQMFYFQEAVMLALRLEKHGVSHIHNHLGDTSGTVTMLASELSGIGYSITIHGPHIFFDPLHWALREKVARSRFIACISHFCKSQMMLFTDERDWARFRIVHCGIAPDAYAFSEVRPVARKLLYTGRLAVEKGIPVLFESLRMLVKDGYDFQLVLVGDGEDRQRLEALSQELGIDNRVEFSGFRDQNEVREYLRGSDIFILPSFAEGVPVSLMEAMACGVPVIATYVGGIVELVEPEKSGLMVPPSDAVSLAAAISRLLDDCSLRRDLAARGREKVVGEFNLDHELDKLAAFFTDAGAAT